MTKRVLMAGAVLALFSTGCANSSGVMEAEGGTYLISAHAGHLRGGATTANAIAYDDAQKFCAARNGRAVVVTAQERDVYNSGLGGSFGPHGGGVGGGTFAAGNANLRFRCSS